MRTQKRDQTPYSQRSSHQCTAAADRGRDEDEANFPRPHWASRVREFPVGPLRPEYDRAMKTGLRDQSIETVQTSPFKTVLRTHSQ